MTPHPVDCKVAGNDSFWSNGTTPCEQAELRKKFTVNKSAKTKQDTGRDFIIVDKAEQEEEPKNDTSHIEEEKSFFSWQFGNKQICHKIKKLLKEK